MQEFAPKHTSPPAPPEHWPTPPEHWPNDEDLAAFIDGTLDKAESRRIAAHLASCEDCQAIYDGVFEFKKATERAPEEGEVVPFFLGQERGWKMRWLIAAAATLALAVGGWYAFQKALLGPAPKLLVADLAPQVEGREAEGLFWDHSVFRGEAEDTESDLDRQSFQVGALLVNSRLGAQTGNIAKTSEAWRTIGRVVGKVGLMDEEANRILAQANEIDDQASLRRVAVTADATERSLGESMLIPEYLDFGKWTGAGRVAAKLGDKGFFEEARNRRFLAYALKNKEIQPDPEVRRSLEEIAKVWDGRDFSRSGFASLEKLFQSILDQYDFTS